MPIRLPSWHFAATWPAYELLRPAGEITKLGIAYIQTPEGPEKEQLSLDLVRAFHSYLGKYLDMIVRGHVPAYGGAARAKCCRSPPSTTTPGSC